MKFFKITSLVLVVAASVAGCGGAVNATIGGTIVGLASGSTIGLTNTSNGDVITYTFSSSSNTFTFDKSVGANDSYNVTVSTPPANQTCSVTNGNGTVDSSGSSITNIEVVCTAGTGTAVPLTASVAGLNSGAVLVLTDPAAGVLTVTGNATTAAGGTITVNFPNSLQPGAVYNSSVTSVSGGQTCSFLSATNQGTVPATGNPSPEAVSCT